ncbi:MAG: DUF2905 domain-containing protein [Pseudomonadales bacterium]
MANLLIIGGLVIIVVGVLAKFGLLSWFGHLPGDIRIRRDGFSLFVPLTSMLIVSITLSAIVTLINRYIQ